MYAGAASTELCPPRFFSGDVLHREGQAPDAAEARQRVATCWQPYRDVLRAELDRLRDQHSHALLWHGHSVRTELPRLFEGPRPARPTARSSAALGSGTAEATSNEGVNVSCARRFNALDRQVGTVANDGARQCRVAAGRRQVGRKRGREAADDRPVLPATRDLDGRRVADSQRRNGQRRARAQKRILGRSAAGELHEGAQAAIDLPARRVSECGIEGELGGELLAGRACIGRPAAGPPGVRWGSAITARGRRWRR